MDIDLLGLSAKRLNRSSYILTLIVSMILFIAIGLALDAVVKAIFNIHTTDGEPTAIMAIPIIGWWVYAIYCMVRRFHDMNASGWWTLATFVPFLNIYTTIQLLFFKGDSKANKYGEPLNRVCVLSFRF